MSADWVHCNVCYFLPSATPARKFFLGSCSHIFCGNCAEKIVGEKKCKVCNQACNIMEINRQMKPDVQEFFIDPQIIAKKLNKVMDFQKGHRTKLVKYYNSQLKKARQLLEQYQAGVKRIEQMQGENNQLREENQRLVIELRKSEAASQHRGGTVRTTPGSGGHSGAGRNGTPSSGYNMTASGGRGLRKTPDLVTPDGNRLSFKWDNTYPATTPQLLGVSDGSRNKTPGIGVFENPYMQCWQQTTPSPMQISPRRPSGVRFEKTTPNNGAGQATSNLSTPMSNIRLPFNMNPNTLPR